MARSPSPAGPSASFARPSAAPSGAAREPRVCDSFEAVALPKSLGRHAMSFAGDVLEIHYDGHISLADSEQLRDILIEIDREHGSCFLLVDMRLGLGIDRDARQYMKEWSKQEQAKLRGTAIYGVSFTMRAIAMLMLNAIKLLGRQESEVSFLKDEAEARRWIDARRQALKEDSHGAR